MATLVLIYSRSKTRSFLYFKAIRNVANIENRYTLRCIGEYRNLKIVGKITSVPTA